MQHKNRSRGGWQATPAGLRIWLPDLLLGHALQTLFYSSLPLMQQHLLLRWTQQPERLPSLPTTFRWSVLRSWWLLTQVVCSPFPTPSILSLHLIITRFSMLWSFRISLWLPASHNKLLLCGKILPLLQQAKPLLPVVTATCTLPSQARHEGPHAEIDIRVLSGLPEFGCRLAEMLSQQETYSLGI